MSVGLRSGLYDAFVPPWAAGRYYFIPNILGTTTSAALGVASLRAAPFYVPSAITVTRIGAEITSAGDAGSKLRLGIYADDGTGRPGNLRLDAGTIAGDSATVQEITGLSLALNPGWYWAAGAVQVVTVTQPTVRCHSGGIVPVDVGASIPGSNAIGWGSSVGSVSGALPTVFGATGSSGIVPRIFLKT